MNKELKVVKLAEILPYERNPRINDDAVDAVKESIRQCEYIAPIVVDEGMVILAGHTRVKALSELGRKQVEVLQVTGLTPTQKKKYRLLDNKTTEFADWDYDLLDEELADLDFGDFDFGFDLDIDEIEPEEVVEVQAPELPDEPVSKPGDIYKLGSHRLICGDSTSGNVVEDLMAGKKAQLVVTDPPYNMNYQGTAGNRKKKIANDNLSDEDFERFLYDAYTNYYMSMEDGASIYTFYKEMGTGVFITQLEAAGLQYKQELIWVKDHLNLSGSKYQNIYEPILYGVKGTQPIRWNGARKQRSVIESIDFMDEKELRAAIKDLQADTEDLDIIRENKTKINDLHPTMKPIRLLSRLIQNSSNRGDIVMDLFGGSGSTLIAYEQLGRSCYMCELDPRYVDVIIERWEIFTGEKAVLLNGKE